tara:strand:- start:467 stop:934 length:468 start_codon:yes stop_codon:yes gene_type:complete
MGIHPQILGVFEMSLGKVNRKPIVSNCFTNLKELLATLKSFQRISEQNHLIITHDSSDHYREYFTEDFDFSTTKEARSNLNQIDNTVTFCNRLCDYDLARATLIEVSLTDDSIVYDVEIAHQQSFAFDSWDSGKFPVKYKANSTFSFYLNEIYNQ